MTSVFEMKAIGWVRGGRTEAIDDDWGDVETGIELDTTVVGANALRGLEEFSHLDVVFVFHGVDPSTVNLGARRPRGNPDWPEVGILAQRAKARVNRIGVTTCEILAVDETVVRVRGLDAIDGTPVLDLKPYLREFGPRGDVCQPKWSSELMRGYW